MQVEGGAHTASHVAGELAKALAALCAVNTEQPTADAAPGAPAAAARILTHPFLYRAAAAPLGRLGSLQLPAVPQDSDAAMQIVSQAAGPSGVGQVDGQAPAGPAAAAAAAAAGTVGEAAAAASGASGAAGAAGPSRAVERIAGKTALSTSCTQTTVSYHVASMHSVGQLSNH